MGEKQSVAPQETRPKYADLPPLPEGTVIPDDPGALVDLDPDKFVVPDDISELMLDPDVPENNPENGGHPGRGNTEPLRIVLASLDSNVDDFAREAAHERLAKKVHEGPAWKRFAKSVWHTITREYQVVKETQKARQEIIESGNLRHHHGRSDEKMRQNTVKRYSSEYAEHIIKEEAGETFHKLGAAEAERDPNAATIRTGTLDLVAEYARGNIVDKASFEAALERKVEEWAQAGISQDYIGEGKFLGHNAFAAAEQAKAALDAKEGLSNLERDEELQAMLANAEIVMGEAKAGSSVEMRRTMSERIAEKLKNVPFLNESRIARVTAFLGNELVVAGIISATLGVATKAAALIPGIGAGIVGAVRERRAVMDERALSERRRDAGKEEDPTNKRQRKIGETLNEARDASDLISEVSSFYDDEGHLNFTDREGFDKALQLQAELQARMDLQYGQKARLINFGEDSSTFDLELAMAKLEADMGKLFTNPVAVGVLDIKPEETYADMLRENTDIAIGALSEEMREKDKLFNKFKRCRMFTRGTITAAVALILPAAAEAASEYVGDLFDKVGGALGVAAAAARSAFQKMFPEFFADNPNMTPVAHTTEIGDPFKPTEIGGTFKPTEIGDPFKPTEISGEPFKPTEIGSEPFKPTEIGGPFKPTEIGGEGMQNAQVLEVGEHAKVTLPEGFNVEMNGSQAVVTGPNGQTFAVAMNPDGTIPQGTIDTLKAQGFIVVDQVSTVDGEPKITHEKVTATEYYQNHKQDMVKIKHVMWYDNNTVGRYDLNELGLHNNLRSNGDILISVKGMTSEGSFHGSSGADWKDAAADGHMKIFISASPGSQAHAFELPVGPDGTVVLSNDHPARALFDAKGEFIGGYQHASIEGGTTADGAKKLATLATVVGTHAGEFNDTIVTPTKVTEHSYTIVPPTPMDPTAAAEHAPDDGPIIPVPIYARSRLGDAKQGTPPAETAVTAEPPNAIQAGGATTSPNTVSPDNGGGITMQPLAPGNYVSIGGPSTEATGERKDSTTPSNTAANTIDNQPQPVPSGTRATGQAGGNAPAVLVQPPVRAQGSPASQGPEQNQPEQYPGFTPEEVARMEAISKDTRALPEGFTFPDFAQKDAILQKLVIGFCRETIDHNARDSGESLSRWRVRVAEDMRRRANLALASLDKKGTVSPAARPLFEEAMRIMVGVVAWKPRRRPAP